MEEQLIQYLLADAGLIALVDDRIHWRERPQGGGLPDITIDAIGALVDYHMQGASDLRQQRLQFNCWSNVSLAQALTVRRALETALSGLRTNLSGVEIQGAFIDDINDAWDVFPEGSENFYRYRIDFLIWSSVDGGT